MSIQQRKKDHLDLTAYGDVVYRKSAGFDEFDFVHNALPETDLDKVSLTASLLDRDFAFPLFISSMTGGYTEAGSVNTLIAKFCERNHLPFGVGSQRIMLEKPEERTTFSVAREHAPNAFIAANIGGAQLTGGIEQKQIEILVDSIKADAIIVHLNPLQELMQAEGDRDFSGIESGIKHLISNTDLPVIVKETGAGISGSVARRLLEIGVRAIDVAGSGGTSWARVENLRKDPDAPYTHFDNWGLSTIDCITDVAELRSDYQFYLIASGGVRSSFDMMKSIALGSDFCAMAQPVIRALKNGGLELLEQQFEKWERDCRMILTLLGCTTLNQLNTSHLKKVNPK